MADKTWMKVQKEEKPGHIATTFGAPKDKRMTSSGDQSNKLLPLVLMVGSILLFYNNFAFALSNFFLFSCWAKWRWLCLLVDFGALVRIKIIDEKKLKETENEKWNCSWLEGICNDAT